MSTKEGWENEEHPEKEAAELGGAASPSGGQGNFFFGLQSINYIL